MSEKKSGCPLSKPMNCKEYYNPKLCSFIRDDKICQKKRKLKSKNKQKDTIEESNEDNLLKNKIKPIK